jgi:heme exporter protein B
LSIERSFAGEHEDGCWQTLTLYPAPPAVLFAAKMFVNLASILLLEMLLVPLFIALTDVPLLARPDQMALIAFLGSTGFAAAGSLIGGLTAGLSNRGGLLALLLLPISAPVLLSSAEATRIMLAGFEDPLWWWWVQLLVAFATVFTLGGLLTFGFVVEE